MPWNSPIWRNRDFARLWAAAFGSAFGSDITHIAFPFVAILTLDATPWQLALLRIVQLLPSFLVGLVAGAWVDRLPRRPIMIGCDLFRAAVLVSVPIAAWLDLLSFVYLLFVAATAAVAGTCFEIADRSLLPGLVGREDLVEANRMLTAGQTVAESTGFAAGGWLVQIASASGALAIDALTFVWSAVNLWKIERPEPPAPPVAKRPSILFEIRAGLQLVVRDRLLRPLGASVLVQSVGMGIIGTVFMLYVNQQLGFSPGVLGVIFATGGLWSLLGSLSVGRATAWLGVGPLLIACLLLTSLSQSLVALVTSVSAIAVTLLLVQQMGDLAWTSYEITQVSVRQGTTPDEFQGRMNSCFHLLEVGGTLLGALVGGWLGGAIGLRGTIVAGAVCAGVAALPVALSTLRRLRSVPSIPLASGMTEATGAQ